MIIAGIDPGISGGIAFITDNGEIIAVEKMPTITVNIIGRKRKTKKEVDVISFSRILIKNLPTHVFIEKVGAMPGQGVSSMFSFGMSYGMVLGICRALHDKFHTELVTPQRWQKSINLNETGASAKERTRSSVHKIFNVESNNDGIIDALAIAEYGRRITTMTQ